MDEEARVRAAAEAIAVAIERRDTGALAALLAPGFVQRSASGEVADAAAFLAAIAQIPGEIVFVRLERIEIDLCGGGALASGVQHARVRIDGAVIDDRRGFVDWFVADEDGRWRIRTAVDHPAGVERVAGGGHEPAPGAA